MQKGPQFTPWFETRCTVDIDRFYNFRYPLCMGKLSYLKQKDDTPLITNSTAEDDETMNGRKAGWTKGSSSNVNSTLGYGDECSMNIRYVTELSQYPVTCAPCLSRRGNATGTKWSWYTKLWQCQLKFFLWSVKKVENKFLEIEMRGKVNLFKFG